MLGRYHIFQSCIFDGSRCSSPELQSTHINHRSYCGVIRLWKQILQTSLSRSSSSSRRSLALAWMSMKTLTISCWRPIRGDQLRPLRFTSPSIVSSSLSIIRFCDDNSFRRICIAIQKSRYSHHSQMSSRYCLHHHLQSSIKMAHHGTYTAQWT